MSNNLIIFLKAHKEMCKNSPLNCKYEMLAVKVSFVSDMSVMGVGDMTANCCPPNHNVDKILLRSMD